MPIYEYQCTECGHELEALQKMSDDALTNCPACGQSGLRKLISASGFRLSGSGWYETDFKSGDKKKNLAGDSTGSSENLGSKAAESTATKNSSSSTNNAGSSGNSAAGAA